MGIVRTQGGERVTSVTHYFKQAQAHLEKLVSLNEAAMVRISDQVVSDVKQGRSLLVFGSGHSAIFPIELYHRAGGASFVIPLVADHLMPTAGPTVVRVQERTAGVANFLLSRAEARPEEMLWLASQSGINAATVDLALEAKKGKLRTVAFTSLVHSRAVESRHPSGKKLFEVCDEIVDLGGFVGDSSVPLRADLRAGPLSTLGMICLGHSILVAAMARLEAEGVRCVYSSVNTPQGEEQNRFLEEVARKRDPLLR